MARLIVGLYAPTRGTIGFDGIVVAARRRQRDAAAQRAARRGMQMIFQDPYASLNPRWRVADIVAEPIARPGAGDAEARGRRARRRAARAGRARGRRRREVSAPVLGRTAAAHLDRPRAFDAARAFLVCDEPTSALDVSVQAQVLNLMRDLQRRLGLTYLFISHNLAVVHHIADRVGVMYLGRIVELAPTRRLFAAPRHPYTRMLLDAGARPRDDRQGAHGGRGRSAEPARPAAGMHVSSAMSLRDERCRREIPVLHRWLATAASVACHAVEEGDCRARDCEPIAVTCLERRRVASR